MTCCLVTNQSRVQSQVLLFFMCMQFHRLHCIHIHISSTLHTCSAAYLLALLGVLANHNAFHGWQSKLYHSSTCHPRSVVLTYTFKFVPNGSCWSTTLLQNLKDCICEHAAIVTDTSSPLAGSGKLDNEQQTVNAHSHGTRRTHH